jgi:small multidrug resistance pump
MMHWLILLTSILFEVLGTSFLKHAFQPDRIIYAVLALVISAYVASFALLGFALRHFDLSVAYAIWAGLGTTLVALVGVVFFGDKVTALKLASIAMIVAGIVGLNLSGVSHG